MSVIFRTLKKLRGQSLEGKEGDEKLKRGRNIYSFRRIIFSPLGIISLAIFIFLSGMGTLYGVSCLKDYFEWKSRESFLLRRDKTQAKETEKRVKIDRLTTEEAVYEEATVVPPPPKTIPVEEARPGRLYLPSAKKKKSPAKEIKTVRYIPPRSEKKPERPGKKITSAEPPTESPIPTKETPPTGFKREERPSGPAISEPSARSKLLPKRPEISPVSPFDAPKVKSEPDQSAIELPPVAPDIAKSDRVKVPAIELPSKALPKLELKEISIPSGISPLPEKPVKQKETKIAEEKRIHLANIERSAKIASLVAKVQRSIRTWSSDQIRDLIDQLESLKGEDNSYILKLRAFWHLRQDDYKLAASFLKKVLSKNENDLEAGINMAILEIKTNSLIEAGKRLARLREIYPENTLIPELIQKLK